MFRRRRREGGEQPGPDDQVQAEPGEPPGAGTGGPWDSADSFPEAERYDCGSLLIPVRDGFDVQVNLDYEQGSWVGVVHEGSGMQLQAFAAGRSTPLWDEVREEIAVSVAESGGSCEECEGPFGTELRAHVLMGEGEPETEPYPVRFIGVDGPRWFLRGVVSGPAAQDRTLGRLFDETFAEVVVVRGDHPAPQRQLLEIRLPEYLQQAIESQTADEEPGWDLPNPFERGPEITETR